jgi:hypothetical protein
MGVWSVCRGIDQCCQMVYLHTRNPTLGMFGGSWNGKCWYILWSFGIFYNHSSYVVMAFGYFLWSLGRYILSRYGILSQEKSGNPGRDRRCTLLNTHT